MDEQAFLHILRDEPDNEEVRSAYLQWLEDTGDRRAAYVHRMRQRLKLQEQLEEIQAKIRESTPQIECDWLDVAFPLRIRANMVGRCYVAPQPGAAPYVKIGDRVKPDTVVCLIESLKIFNEITAGVAGVITEVVVVNEESVEYNQTLFRLKRYDPWDDWLDGWCWTRG